MASPYKNKLEGAISHLLNDICITWGICIPPQDFDKIMFRDFHEAEEFALMVLEAEKMGSDTGFKYQIMQKFIKKFGPEVSVESYENSRR